MNIGENLICFKAYDIRGKLGEEINEDVAYRIGRATAQSRKAKSVVVGFDARETSPVFANAVSRGICDAGANVIDIGLAGTEEMYAAVAEFETCAGIEITASHNPINYNGMKIVGQGSQPLTNQEFGLIKALAQKSDFSQPNQKGVVTNKKDLARSAYISKIINFVDCSSLQPLKIVINSGNGAAGPTLDALNE